eukprot:scaffold5176_cov298-Prasinococcus_capsulatus_cf.AAC.2
MLMFIRVCVRAAPARGPRGVGEGAVALSRRRTDRPALPMPRATSPRPRLAAKAPPGSRPLARVRGGTSAPDHDDQERWYLPEHDVQARWERCASQSPWCVPHARVVGREPRPPRLRAALVRRCVGRQRRDAGALLATPPRACGPARAERAREQASRRAAALAVTRAQPCDAAPVPLGRRARSHSRRGGRCGRWGGRRFGSFTMRRCLRVRRRGAPTRGPARAPAAAQTCAGPR